MGDIIALVFSLLSLVVAFFVVALAVKYGVLWALRSLSDEELARIGQKFRR